MTYLLLTVVFYCCCFFFLIRIIDPYCSENMYLTLLCKRVHFSFLPIQETFSCLLLASYEYTCRLQHVSCPVEVIIMSCSQNRKCPSSAYLVLWDHLSVGHSSQYRLPVRFVSVYIFLLLHSINCSDTDANIGPEPFPSFHHSCFLMKQRWKSQKKLHLVTHLSIASAHRSFTQCRFIFCLITFSTHAGCCCCQTEAFEPAQPQKTAHMANPFQTALHS